MSLPKRFSLRLKKKISREIICPDCRAVFPTIESKRSHTLYCSGSKRAKEGKTLTKLQPPSKQKSNPQKISKFAPTKNWIKPKSNIQADC